VTIITACDRAYEYFHHIMPMNRSRLASMTRSTLTVVVLLSLACYTGPLNAQNVFLVVIEGVRYTETFAAGTATMPNISRDIRPQGTLCTNVWNDGTTESVPCDAAMLTGSLQSIAKNGSERPAAQTLFELLRRQRSVPADQCLVIGADRSLSALTHGADSSSGRSYGASFVFAEPFSDLAIMHTLFESMDRAHPRFVLVSFPETDRKARTGNREEYLGSLQQIDRIISLLWKRLQSDSFYKNTTTLLVTSDHGRHDDAHGGFQRYGDACEGCTHVVLLAVGPRFPKGVVNHERMSQVDIAPTIADLFSLQLPRVIGRTMMTPGEHTVRTH
jgi:hypothetical protein